MVVRNQEYSLSWNELYADTAVNLYLYGTLTTPENLYDRIYPENYVGGALGGPRVLLSAVEYMSDGPGRYATAALAPAIEDFLLNRKNVHLEPGAYTRTEIQQFYGYQTVGTNGSPSNDGFRIVLQHFTLDKASA